ncbi:hypothetical protein FF38_13133 [Lucilia cuprina]|uniref:Uncharacterized protein n=1 Tax=Lucilia cuprina TaxID=7375 RepID=A0A0L0CPH7_LUCCU|nr:hypothetical protein FF38_13133 [Lucilia cuprina]
MNFLNRDMCFNYGSYLLIYFSTIVKLMSFIGFFEDCLLTILRSSWSGVPANHFQAVPKMSNEHFCLGLILFFFAVESVQSQGRLLEVWSCLKVKTSPTAALDASVVSSGCDSKTWIVNNFFNLLKAVFASKSNSTGVFLDIYCEILPFLPV